MYLSSGGDTVIKVKYTIILILSIVGLFVLGAFISSYIIEDIMLPDNFLFYEHTPLANIFFVLLLALFAVVGAYFILGLVARIFGDNIDDVLDQLVIAFSGRKAKILVLALLPVWLFGFYMVMTSLTYVTPDEIVVMQPFDIDGEHYGYNEVEYIETGFGTESFTIYEYDKEGNFYYKIALDGKESIFCAPSVNKNIEEYDDSYIELEIFDKALCKLVFRKPQVRTVMSIYPITMMIITMNAFCVL